MGANIIENNKVISIEQEGDKAKVITEQGDIIRAKIVISAGMWSRSR